jgi:Tol biopolymer transport system component
MTESQSAGRTRHKLQRRFYRLTLTTVLATLLSACNWTATSSVSSAGEPGNSASGISALSADGRIVAFVSTATNLDPAIPVVGADPLHVYVHDARLRKTVMISADSSGVEGNGYSFDPSVSAHGRYVAYQSLADNLVPGDNNGIYDIFVYDRKTGRNTRISPSTRDGMEAVFNSAPSISGNGRYIAYFSQARGTGASSHIDETLLVHDRRKGGDQKIRVTGEESGKRYRYFNPSISGDGRRVAFEYGQDVLAVPVGIVVYDQDTGNTRRVSIDSEGVAGNASSVYPAISADGRYVAFASVASNLVAADNNGAIDIFVHDLVTGSTERVSVDSHGNEADMHSLQPAISGDGRYVTFLSSASNLVDDDTNGVADAFVHDRQSGTTRRVSLSAMGEQANGETYEPVVISTDGRYVSFASEANNLVANDTNDFSDVFLRAVPQVTVTSVEPDHLPIGSTTSVTIKGTDFLEGATPQLGAWISKVVIVDENTMTMDITVPAYAAPGARTLSVSFKGTGPGVLSGATGKCEDCVTFF